MVDVADIVAGRLYESGCRYAWGIPGGEVLVLIEGLRRAGIEFGLAKHENAAGFMAEGGFHADGAPGILVATVGPGVANAANVVANAHQDRVPLIVLTGCVDAELAVTYTHQVFDHRALMAPITKAGFTLTAGAADAAIDKAVAIALDDPPGPVHIDVPISVAGAECKIKSTTRRSRPRRGAPAGPDLDTARNWLEESTRPVMLAGIDVLNHRAEDITREFALRFGVPLVTTYKAKGVLPEDHDLSLGGAGLSPKADKHLLPLIADSDLVLLAGYDPIEMRTGWYNPWPESKRVVEFCAVPNTHYAHQAGLSFVGDVGLGLAALGDGVSPRPTWPGGEAAMVRQDLKDAFADDGQWGPAAVLQVAREVLPRDTVATVDTGAHRILLSQMWECYEPRTLLQSSGLCTMGCALPLATGYKVVRPDRPVVAFTGDAGLEMVLGELATLRDTGLPVIVIVFIDESLALIEMKQRGSGYPNTGVDFGATDFVGVGAAMSMHSVWVEDKSELESALHKALASPQSSLIACRVGPRSYDGKI